MKKICLLISIIVSQSSLANVIDDYKSPLLIDGKKIIPHLSSKGFTEIESNVIADLSNLYKDGAIESFCKGWGYGKNVSHYQFFLNSGSYTLLRDAFGKEKSNNLSFEAMKIAKMQQKKIEPYLVLMKNKADTGTEVDKEYYENELCYSEINGSRMYSAAGISLSISEHKAIK